MRIYSLSFFCMKITIERKSHPWIKNVNCLSSLFTSCACHWFLLLISPSDHEKETALHHASASGSLETVKWILKKQSNALNPSILNLENRVGETAAMFAAVEGHTEILQLLLKSGARLWGSSNGSERSNTCLDWAVDSKKSKTGAAILEEKDWKEVGMLKCRAKRDTDNMPSLSYQKFLFNSGKTEVCE